MSIPFIFATSIVYNWVDTGSVYNQKSKHPLVFCCLTFFVIQVGSLLYTNDFHQGWRNILLKLQLVIIPLSVFGNNYLNERVRNTLMKWYCLALFLACSIALAVACKTYQQTHQSGVFLYHALVGIYSGHAIQYSILAFVAIVFLVEMAVAKSFYFTRPVHVFVVIFFSVFVILLSSKLVICFYIVYIGVAFARFYRNRIFNKAFVVSVGGLALAGLAFMFLNNNPINNRFKDIEQTNFDFLKKNKFDPGEYFNGLEFRLLQWKFVPQILNEHNAWLKGVSVGDAQNLLNEKYISEHMYIGSHESGDKGFIGYNTHNELLEALLQSGVPGLLSFLSIIVSLVWMIWKERRNEFGFIAALLMIYSCTESVLESQYSLLIFIFFPLLFYPTNNGKEA